MIRRIINRVRRQEPSQPVLFTPNDAPTAEGAPAVVCKGTRRGRSQRPIRLVRLQNRARNKRARAARRMNRS